MQEIKSVLENRIPKPDHLCQTDFICGCIHVIVYMASHYKMWLFIYLWEEKKNTTMPFQNTNTKIKILNLHHAFNKCNKQL